jgi:hypothetical protein
MDTEVWIRNPKLCIRECAEVGVTKFSWDYGFLLKRGIDLQKFMSLYYGSRPWESLVVNDAGAAHVDAEHRHGKNPRAVYPVWSYGSELDELVELMANPVGDQEGVALDPDLKLTGWAPLFGQAHYVVVNKLPDMRYSMGQQILRVLSELQEEYPACRLHIHGLYTFQALFGLEFASVDWDPRPIAAIGKVILPNGSCANVDEDKIVDYQHWIELFGFKLADLQVPRNRCIYNIYSLLWAGENYRKSIKFKHKGFDAVDPDDPFKRNITNKSIFVRRVNPTEDDKFFCDTCSLSSACKYFRTGAMCTVPDTEAAGLANFFGTRDAGKIQEGLSELLKVEAARLDRALEMEREAGGVSKEVTAMISNMFKHAESMAKLVDPSLRGLPAGPQSLTQNNFNFTIGENDTIQETTAKVVEYLVTVKNIPKHLITKDMVMEVLQQPGDDVGSRALEARTLPSTIEATA